MTIDFSAQMTDLKGESLPKENGADITLGYVAISMLMASDAHATDADKLTRFRLAYLIANATGPVNLSLEDAALVKKLIGKHPWPLIVGRAYEMLEK